MLYGIEIHLHQHRPAKRRFEFDKNSHHLQTLEKNGQTFDEILLNIWGQNGANVCKTCRASQMLHNEYLAAHIGFDATETSPPTFDNAKMNNINNYYS